MIASAANIPVPANNAPTPLVPNSTSGASSGISFGAVLDAVNPLQHIPVISSLYRAATGSQISTGSQVVGDTIYGALMPGGIIAGFASSAANIAIKEVTGKDVGQIVMGTLTPSSSTASSSGTATPLVATPPSDSAAAQAASSIPSVPLLRTDHSAAQYQRAQILDAGNKRLIKMTS